MVRRPTEIITGFPLAVLTADFLVGYGLSQPLAGVIGLTVGLAPLGISKLVDLMHDGKNKREGSDDSDQ